MNTLIIGGAGFIGSHTADALLARGHHVRVLDSLEQPVHTGDWPDYLDRRIDLRRASIADRAELILALDGIDVVFNFAAYQDYLTDFSRFFTTNAAGTALIYEIIVNERFPIRKIVVASSQAVFGEGLYRCARHGKQQPGPRPRAQLERGAWDVICPVCSGPMDVLPIKETYTNPQTCYGLSKHAQEEIALTLGRQYGIPSVALRYSIVQGPRQSLRNAYSGALRSFTMRALCGEAPVLFEDGGQLRDYVSVHDVVRANLLALEDDRACFQAYNVGGDRRVSVLQLAEMVIGAANAPVAPEVPGIFRVGDSRHIVSDVSKLQALGWQPLVSQQDIVNEYVEWAASQHELRDAFADARRRMTAAGVLQPSQVHSKEAA
ncbi:MAG: NAD-dependent epimerase/dehydratase family protein [Chloroflexi bacterium]|nr:NAD-dependent epimerase/dehydratase family protein [Chloroflexota bacterium]